MMSLFSKKKRKEIEYQQSLFDLCKKYIVKSESSLEVSSRSCQTELLQIIKKHISEFTDLDEIFEDPTSDIDMYANIVISNVTFDMLVTGKYHLYYGVINPMGIGPTLLKVYEGAMEWSLNHKYIDLKTKTEQFEYLKSRIATIG